MIRFLFLLLLLVSALTTQAQTLVVSGRVCDPDSVPLTRVKVKNQAKVVYTNKNGIFSLPVTAFPSSVVFSHPGYQTREIVVSKELLDSLKNDTLYLPIVLIQVTVELPTVDITDKPERAYDKPRILILDYDFYKDGLVLLLKENKKYKLRLADENSVTLCDLELKNNPVKLFTDCYHHLHVLGTEKGYQIFCTDTALIIIDTIPTVLFNDLLLPCVGSSETHVFLSSFSNHNQRVAYLGLKTGSKQAELIHEVTDDESARFVDYFYRKTMADIGYVNLTMSEINAADLDKARQVEQDVWYYAKVLNRPVYNPFLCVRDSFFIFNHVRDSVFIFNKSGLQQRSMLIDYHYLNGWKQELLVDAIENTVYARYLRGGLVYLTEINLNTGKPLQEYKLVQHAFPENIKVHNGYAYYLYATDDFNVTNVYRQKVK